VSGQHRGRPARWWNLRARNLALLEDNAALRSSLARREADHERLATDYRATFQELMRVRELTEPSPVEQPSKLPAKAVDATQPIPRVVKKIQRPDADKPTSAMATTLSVAVNLNRNSE
jgi:hypothetical protein